MSSSSPAPLSPQPTHEMVRWESATCLRLEERARWRAVSALRRGAYVALGVSFAMMIVFAADLAASWRAADGSLWSWAGALAVVSGTLGFAAALSRVMRREAWVLDSARDELRRERRSLGGQWIEVEALPLEHLRSLRALDSRLEATLEDTTNPIILLDHIEPAAMPALQSALALWRAR